MTELKQYELNIKEYENFVLLVRNALMSKVTGSSLHAQEVKAIKKALGKTIKSEKKLKKIMNKFKELNSDVTRYEEIVPTVNAFIHYLKRKTTK